MRATNFVVASAAVLIGCANNPATDSVTPSALKAEAAAVRIVSGNNQLGKAGEPLDARLVAQVTDADGRAASNVTVNFFVADGAGTLAVADDFVPGLSSRTNKEGIVSVAFRPNRLGRSSVTAQLGSGTMPSVAFTVAATVLVIERWGPLYDIGFIASPCFCSDVTVPIGTPIEWKNHMTSATPDMTFTVTSILTPQGGASFDSGVIGVRDRFRFVPTVRGTWQYRDTLTGHAGTITAN